MYYKILAYYLICQIASEFEILQENYLLKSYLIGQAWIWIQKFYPFAYTPNQNDILLLSIKTRDTWKEGVADKKNTF